MGWRSVKFLLLLISFQTTDIPAVIVRLLARRTKSGSNHPPSVIRNIPAAVNRRLSSISANEAVFKEAAPLYQEALENSGFAYKLAYEPPTNFTTEKQNRKRRITWFNPP